MLNGELYNAEDKNLKNERIKCKLLCPKYSNLDYDKFKERNSLIRQILGKAGKKCLIEQPFICDYGYK